MAELFSTAFANLMTGTNIFLMLVGVVVGIIFGCVPGLSAAMAIALFLPVTFGLPQYSAFALLMALYIGGVSGSLISAILINVPGSSQSIATCYDGHPMAVKGEAHRALGTGMLFSFIGTMFSLVILIFAAPVIADYAVKLGNFEFFSLVTFALVLIICICGGNIVKAILAGLLGMATTFVGIAPVDSIPRFTFGTVSLMDGFTLLPMVIGMFAVTTIMGRAAKPIGTGIEDKLPYKRGRGFGFSFKEFLGQTKNWVLSAVIGVFIGFLPGMGGSLANQLAYATVKKASKYPEKFGTGIMDGVVASETSNNASIGGAMIPLLALGIPGDGPTAMLLGAFMIQGLSAGPLLFTTNADLCYVIFVAMGICTALMLLEEYFGIPLFLQTLKIPQGILLPVIVMLCVVGAYASGNKVFCVWTVFIFGTVGYLFGRAKVPGAPFILGAVLGPMIESNLRRALQISHGSFLPFLTRPVSCIFIVASVLIIVTTVIHQMKAASKSTAEE